MRIPFFLVALLMAPVSAAAQPSTNVFENLQKLLEPGQQVVVVDGPAGEAARAAAILPATTEVGGAPRQDSDSQSDWSRVARLEGDEIVLSLRGSSLTGLHGTSSGRRTVVRGSVTETSLAVLDLTDPSIPSEAKDALKRAAAVHPEIFTQQTQGSVVRVSRWVRFEAGAVFINDRRAVELDHVIERVDRNDVAEISAPHRATKQGMVWGALLGAGIGLAVAHENYVAPVGFPVVGMVWGAGVGFLIKTSTVVYRAP